MKYFSRRNFLGSLIALPTGLCLNSFYSFAAPVRNQVKITAIKAIQLDYQIDGCLIKIETDSGLVGYGETGTDSRIARAHIDHLVNALQKTRGGSERLIGGDPLSIERHFYQMMQMYHPLPAPVGTISGIDIALWDLAGKILNQPVYKLLGGPFRDGCPMYAHVTANMHDPASCRKWAEYIKQQPEGFKIFKTGQGFPSGMPFHPTVTNEEIKLLRQGFTNLREAAGDSIGLALHGHGEFDTPSAIAMSNAIAHLNIAFSEDLLNPLYSNAWLALKRGTSVPVMTGEKLETIHQFKPFLDSQAVDFIHLDISYAGGFTGCMKIADYAALTRTPVALHNVGSLVRTYASGHLSMAIQNFYKCESRLDRREAGVIEQMTVEGPSTIRNGILQVPDKPGLGITIDQAHLKKHLVKNEPWWGYDKN